MDWLPITRTELEAEINRGVAKMPSTARHLWRAIRVQPQKWKLPPWGDEGGGFWVVAILGRTAIWYNDIEDGFNRSPWTMYGVIDDYRCDQDELQDPVGYLLSEIQTGAPAGSTLGPPKAL